MVSLGHHDRVLRDWTCHDGTAINPRQLVLARTPCSQRRRRDGMHIKKLRVKARQGAFAAATLNLRDIDALGVAPFHEPCAAEMTAMLGCWAATKDSMSVGACASAAQGLFACMRTVVCACIKCMSEIVVTWLRSLGGHGHTSRQ